ncbi:unnamed protein product [Cylicostephanus goldi]|uniref:Methylmalonyl-CoA mutase alpha/beta chain catalytic domain-containing protein n=1 Tax=Cylicostephanus goldi TaxID=71465 RepID=A0A3P7QIH7_CYLGO|nr:unnamed protein product [Cylicostephanus goldi]
MKTSLIFFNLQIIAEVDELGGMAKAVASGMAKTKIEESAAKKQARIDSGKDVIVGVNKYQTDEKTQFEVLKVDNKKVAESQFHRLEQLRNSRNHHDVDRTLDALTKGAAGKENLLALAVEAARARCTVGEISLAMEKVFTRIHFQNQSEFFQLNERIKKFAEKEGRQPRIMVTKMGQDGHDRGAKVIASAFADFGMG